MKVTWNKKDATYYDRGRKAYGFGDEIPEQTLIDMGEETAEEYKEKGWLKVELPVSEKIEAPEPELETDEEKAKRLRDEAISLGLKPHHMAGIEKLQQMIDDHKKDSAEN